VFILIGGFFVRFKSGNSFLKVMDEQRLREILRHTPIAFDGSHGGGQECYVLFIHRQDFVMKVLHGEGVIHPAETLEGYGTCMQNLGDRIPPTSVLENVELLIQGRDRTVLERVAIAQQKRPNLQTFLGTIRADARRYASLAEDIARAEVDMLNAGCYCFDPKDEDMGLTPELKLEFLDLGLVRRGNERGRFSQYNDRVCILRAFRFYRRLWRYEEELGTYFTRAWEQATELDFEKDLDRTITDTDIRRQIGVIVPLMETIRIMPPEFYGDPVKYLLENRRDVDVEYAINQAVLKTRHEGSFLRLGQQEKSRHYRGGASRGPAQQLVEMSYF
jgi:hypothetical protein